MVYSPINSVILQNLIYYKKQVFDFYNFPITIERFGKICILSISSYTPSQNTAIITGLPEWAIPITSQCGALTGDGVPIATGEMYVRTDGGFQFFVNKIDAPALYTGQIIYIAKN